jgi:hypothetical protein
MPFDLTRFHGIFPAAMTMFDIDGNLDETSTAEHWQWLIEQGADGLWVEREFARARSVYASHGAAGRVELCWGHGGHQVFGERSFEFLDQWLK